jgi:hypothetical protein
MGDLLSKLGDGLWNAFLMAWEVWWALVLGFAISAIVQAWVPRERIERALSGEGLAPIAKATGLGAASSSCSYAAIAIAKSLFQKGASAASALAFQSGLMRQPRLDASARQSARASSLCRKGRPCRTGPHAPSSSGAGVWTDGANSLANGPEARVLAVSRCSTLAVSASRPRALPGSREPPGAGAGKVRDAVDVVDGQHVPLVLPGTTGPVVGVEHHVVDPEPAQRIVGGPWRQLSESGPECRRA